MLQFFARYLIIFREHSRNKTLSTCYLLKIVEAIYICISSSLRILKQRELHSEKYLIVSQKKTFLQKLRAKRDMR